MSSSLPLLLLLSLSAPAPLASAAPAHPLPSELAGEWPAQPSGKHVTVEAKTPNEALKEIASAAGWGLALNSGAAGEANVAFSFKGVPVEEALAAVLYASKLHAVRIGDSVAVMPKDPTDLTVRIGGDSEVVEEREEVQQNGGTTKSTTTRTERHHHHHSNGNDRVQVGHDIDIPAGAKVGAVVAVGGSIHLGPGASTNDVVAIGGHIEADPGVQIEGAAVTVGGDQHLSAGTIVSGDAVTVGGQVRIDPGAAIQGKQVNLGLDSLMTLHHAGWWAGGLFILFWVRKLAEFVLYFCLGSLLVLAVPSQLAAVESCMVRQPLRAGLAGFLATLAIPILTVLLIVTLVGIPLVAVEFFGVALAAVMGFTAISVLIGNRLRVPVRGGGLLGLAIGTAIVVALTSLPWIGGVVLVTSWFIALGAALVTRFGSAQAV